MSEILQIYKIFEKKFGSEEASRLTEALETFIKEKKTELKQELKEELLKELVTKKD